MDSGLKVRFENWISEKGKLAMYSDWLLPEMYTKKHIFFFSHKQGVSQNYLTKKKR